MSAPVDLKRQILSQAAAGRAGAASEISEVSESKQGKLSKQEYAAVSEGKQTGKQEVSRNLALEIHTWLEDSPGRFHVADIDREFNLRTRAEKNNRSKIINGMLRANIIERITSVKGYYQVIDSKLETIDFLKVENNQYNIWLPFELHNLVRILPKNIIVIAGEQNVGKTALLLNVVRNNMADKEICYFTSEMGAAELQGRLLKWEGIRLRDWDFRAYERSDNFHQVIRADGLNIIDFLEVHDEFYKIGAYLRGIYDKLSTGVCIVAIQKNRGCEFGLGGARGLEKPRLYITLSANAPNPNIARIEKAKNYVDQNPNGKQVAFRIHDGWRIEQCSVWHYGAIKKRM
ncbi:MAG TPA: hypothetical protein VEF34_11340 [Syntrophobacteraceae bacterium]|nr:hypothetical protein [Syntrophobacteraceae bacterium]